MAYLEEVPWTIVPIISQLFHGIRANQIGFELVFDKLTFKCMDALRKRFSLLLIMF